MNTHLYDLLFTIMVAATFAAATTAAPPDNLPAPTKWHTVVNTNDPMPNSDASPPLHFNSFNQPAVNTNGLVVFRARSRGGPPLGPPTRGIYTRNMSVNGSINTIIGYNTLVPWPNNLVATFNEFPSVPRISINSHAVATRGNHRPVWTYMLPDGSEPRAGTTGIYVNLTAEDLSSDVVTAAAKLGGVPGFELFSVPEIAGYVPFDVFPGSPAVTDDETIAFKGNYTHNGLAKTGVFFRELQGTPGGGNGYIELIASSDTEIPPPAECPAATTFGSTAPPSAAQGKVVFVGLDDEENPNCGAIYQAPLSRFPELTPLVGIGSVVPGLAETFTRFGEGLSFDGRFVGFWGAWGTDTRRLRLTCPAEGNKVRRQYCNEQYPDGFLAEVPQNQGIFVHDTRKGKTWMVAQTGDRFHDFLFWNFSGRVPGSEGEDDGEMARWRSSAFVGITANGGSVQIAFKARTGGIVNMEYVDPVDGIYLGRAPGKVSPVTLIDTQTPGRDLDPEAPANVSVNELGLERDAFRGHWLVISARMGEDHDEEADSMAGIYVTMPSMSRN